MRLLAFLFAALLSVTALALDDFPAAPSTETWGQPAKDARSDSSDENDDARDARGTFLDDVEGRYQMIDACTADLVNDGMSQPDAEDAMLGVYAATSNLAQATTNSAHTKIDAGVALVEDGDDDATDAERIVKFTAATTKFAEAKLVYAAATLQLPSAQDIEDAYWTAVSELEE